MRGPFCAPKVAHSLGWLSLLHSFLTQLMLICSGSFLFADSVSLSLSLHVCVDVAVFSTLLAIIVRRVLEVACWAGGFAVESAGARICREGGARVTTDMMDLPMPLANDSRRLEIVADGLHLFGGAQLAVDMTLVSSLHCDGTPHRGAANIDGAVLARARQRKEATFPELVGPRARVRLVVLAGDMVKYKFIKTTFIKTNFIKNHFHQKPFSSQIKLREPERRAQAVFLSKRRRPSAGDAFSQLWPTWANPILANPLLDLVCVVVVPRRVGPRRVGGQKFRAFFPSPAPPFSLFLSLSLGCPSR